jgi:hypothetical protein
MNDLKHLKNHVHGPFPFKLQNERTTIFKVKYAYVIFLFLEKNGMKYVETSALNSVNIKSIFENMGLGKE